MASASKVGPLERGEEFAGCLRIVLRGSTHLSIFAQAAILVCIRVPVPLLSVGASAVERVLRDVARGVVVRPTGGVQSRLREGAHPATSSSLAIRRIDEAQRRVSRVVTRVRRHLERVVRGGPLVVVVMVARGRTTTASCLGVECVLAKCAAAEGAQAEEDEDGDDEEADKEACDKYANEAAIGAGNLRASVG